MKKKYIIMMIAGLLVVLGLGALSTKSASATGDDYPYEVDVCWTMANSDGVEGTYEFPQTRGCDTEPACEETIERQYDTYWIRDAEDEAYLAGLTGLNSAADDAQLEPHDYYSVLVVNDEPCVPEQPEPLVQETSETSYECGDSFQTVTTTTTTTEYVLVDNVWVLGEPVVETSEEQLSVEVVPCEEEPETPSEPTKTSQCVGGALIVTTTDAEGNISHSTVNGHKNCSQTTDTGEPIQEEGM